MKWKFWQRMLPLSLALLCFTGCGGDEEEVQEMKPQVMQMRSICELATTRCYYHNVVRYHQEDAEGFLWWTRDKNFWVEYSGIVTVGVDVSLMNIEVDGEDVTITMPNAQILDCKVDEKSLTSDSIVVDTTSAKVDAKDQTNAFKEAQERMRSAAASDTVLLASAQKKAQHLIEDYVNNIGDCIGRKYRIHWVYINNATEQVEDNASEAED